MCIGVDKPKFRYNPQRSKKKPDDKKITRERDEGSHSYILCVTPLKAPDKHHVGILYCLHTVRNLRFGGEGGMPFHQNNQAINPFFSLVYPTGITWVAQ